MSSFSMAQDALEFKVFSPKNWKFLDGKSGLSKKIKVKMGLKKQEAWVDGIVLFQGGLLF